MSTRIVVGLGNPGPRYAQTRHNVGFMVVDVFAERKGLRVERHGHQALYAEMRLGSDRVVLVKPQTYMNLSGESVAAVARWYKVPATDILVVYDDMDIPLGKIRIRERGSSGGHKGMESVIQHLGTEHVPRIRIGIGRPPAGWKVPDWVLSVFAPEEQPVLSEVLGRAADAVEMALRLGVSRAASRFSS